MIAAMSEKLKLRSVRLDDALWERVTLAAADEGRSASQVVAEAVRRYVEEGLAGGAERLQERPGAPGASSGPRQAASAAPGLAQLDPRPVPSAPRPLPVVAVRPWRRSPAGEVPQALGRPDTCPHPLRARRGGVGVVRHCGDCGAPLGLTGIAG
jgi:hypothetical protein